ncbi:hypothetical protein [Inediibacterium massiliense]|uniref:hypothetical protein n=1 Tax=Inediibacterium massiliense TaxID=1658111 RepID=UPI0006B55C99|nr:hypothetical protein [Inediibacterium massiliense]
MKKKRFAMILLIVIVLICIVSLKPNYNEVYEYKDLIKDFKADYIEIVRDIDFSDTQAVLAELKKEEKKEQIEKLGKLIVEIKERAKYEDEYSYLAGIYEDLKKLSKIETIKTEEEKELVSLYIFDLRSMKDDWIEEMDHK